ncbi:hypothetical protein MTO96_008980 [Rhipicephalus appendiculatus]
MFCLQSLRRRDKPLAEPLADKITRSPAHYKGVLRFAFPELSVSEVLLPAAGKSPRGLQCWLPADFPVVYSAGRRHTSLWSTVAAGTTPLKQKYRQFGHVTAASQWRRSAGTILCSLLCWLPAP